MGRRHISTEQIHQAVVHAFRQIYCSPTPKVLYLINQALDTEQDEIACDMLTNMLENAQIGAKEGVPVCQDTGLPVVFAQIGKDVTLEGGSLRAAIEAAAAEAWERLFLRRSIVIHPLFDRHPEARKVPVILHMEQVPGDALILDIALKGGGAENTSALKMFDPTSTPEEIEDFVVQTVVASGGRSCPPVSVGVGIGGNFETCAMLAKHALFTEEDELDPAYQEMRKSILKKINAQGKGVQGFAGATTAIAVKILDSPCHIASLPVAVNIDCHSHRHVRIAV